MKKNKQEIDELRFILDNLVLFANWEDDTFTVPNGSSWKKDDVIQAMHKYISSPTIYHIEVNCEENDPVNRRCGGPMFLGYDFYVEKKPTKQMLSFIENEVRKNNRKFLSINFNEIQVRKDYTLWTKEKIAECIKNVKP